jgi:hypothetical protein
MRIWMIDGGVFDKAKETGSNKHLYICSSPALSTPLFPPYTYIPVSPVSCLFLFFIFLAFADH